MTRSVCSVPRCPAFAIERGRCGEHRLTTDGRGYGRTHGAARRALAATLPAPCAYGCGARLTRGGRWVAAHVVDGDERAGWVASCLVCNERAKRGLRPASWAQVIHVDQAPAPMTVDEVFA